MPAQIEDYNAQLKKFGQKSNALQQLVTVDEQVSSVLPFMPLIAISTISIRERSLLKCTGGMGEYSDFGALKSCPPPLGTSAPP